MRKITFLEIDLGRLATEIYDHLTTVYVYNLIYCTLKVIWMCVKSLGEIHLIATLEWLNYFLTTFAHNVVYFYCYFRTRATCW